MLKLLKRKLERQKFKDILLRFEDTRDDNIIKSISFLSNCHFKCFLILKDFCVYFTVIENIECLCLHIISNLQTDQAKNSKYNSIYVKNPAKVEYFCDETWEDYDGQDSETNYWINEDFYLSSINISLVYILIHILL